MNPLSTNQVSLGAATDSQIKHTLYQVSTATALVEGTYQGAIRVGSLRQHGNLGLGTLENLDGEMVIVDGRVFQVHADGSVREADNEALIPFAVITNFASTTPIILEDCPDLAHLTAKFDLLRSSQNYFYALRVDGLFDFVHTRGCRGRHCCGLQPECGTCRACDSRGLELREADDGCGMVDCRDNLQLMLGNMKEH